MPLNHNQRDRYRRNIDIPGMGEAGQAKLLNSRVLVIGAGGLGSGALPYLTAAGVGHIGIVDGDAVETMNLQRQVLHTTVGENKAISAVARMKALNPEIEIEAFDEYIDFYRARELFANYDLILDCCDTFAAKFLISDAARAVDKPLIWAAAVGMQGQCSVFGVPDQYGEKLWLRDLIPAEPDEYPKAVDVGVLGAMVGQIGTLQATEAIKFLVGFGEPLIGRVYVLDAAAARWDVLPLRSSGAEPHFYPPLPVASTHAVGSHA